MSRNQNFQEGGDLPKFEAFGSKQHELGERLTWRYPDGRVKVVSEADGMSNVSEFGPDEGGDDEIAGLRQIYRQHGKGKNPMLSHAADEDSKRSGRAN